MPIDATDIFASNHNIRLILLHTLSLTLRGVTDKIKNLKLFELYIAFLNFQEDPARQTGLIVIEKILEKDTSSECDSVKELLTLLIGQKWI